MVTIEGGLDDMYRDDPNVFVAGDLLWYPVQGSNTIRAAPDAMVVFGRPKGDRGSYKQWEEEGIAPQVAFEVWSPGNTTRDYTNKYAFYNRYGVQEYYLYDPDRGELYGWIRRRDDLEEIPDMHGWVSPRLSIRFEMAGNDLVLYRPDGNRFKTFLELTQAEREAQILTAYERTVAAQERACAESEHQRAEQELKRANQERERAERLAAQLRALGVEPE